MRYTTFLLTLPPLPLMTRGRSDSPTPQTDARSSASVTIAAGLARGQQACRQTFTPCHDPGVAGGALRSSLVAPVH